MAGYRLMCFAIAIVILVSECVVESSLFAFAQNPQANFDGKRAILDEDPFWTNRDIADQTLRRIKDAGFNVYMPNVWHGRGTTWPSKFAPWDPWLTNVPKENFDPLAYLIAKAHSMGIEVHPWFNIVLRQSSIFPEYALPGYSPAGEAFDVHNEQFRQLMANIVAEVTEKYDIDGINLDYVRAVMLCTTASCQAEYHQKYGRDLRTDALALKVAPKLVPTLVEYQESAVAALVKGISDKIRQRKPNALISVDAIPGLASPDQGQNSVDWAKRGLIDVLFRMDYYRAIDVNLTESVRSHLPNPDSLSLMISNVSGEERSPAQKHFPRDGKWLGETVAMIQQRWPRTGVGVYFYKMLSDEQIAALKSGPFKLTPPTALKIQ